MQVCGHLATPSGKPTGLTLPSFCVLLPGARARGSPAGPPLSANAVSRWASSSFLFFPAGWPDALYLLLGLPTAPAWEESDLRVPPSSVKNTHTCELELKLLPGHC